jgi:hypothetical protein
MYILNIGIQAEWMKDQNNDTYWIAQKTNEILKHMQKISITIKIPIPLGLTLGEHEIRFGLQGQ